MPDVAAFDFDGTLTDGGSVFGFLTAVAGHRSVLSASLALSPRLVHAALAGGSAADTTKELLFERVLAGIDAAHLQRVAAISAPMCATDWSGTAGGGTRWSSSRRPPRPT